VGGYFNRRIPVLQTGDESAILSLSTIFHSSFMINYVR